MSRKKPLGFRPPETVRVYVERNGAGLSADVAWDHGPAALKGLLDAMRLITEEYPELIQQLSDVQGGMQQIYDPFVDGFAKKDSRRIGF